MASRILKGAVVYLKCASMRGFCTREPLKEFDSRLQHLAESIFPSIVSLESSFSGAGGHDSSRCGFGFCLDPTLIITSAHVVGRVFSVYEPRTPLKLDGFEHGSIRHRSDIGTTTALAYDGQKLETRPLAVNFANDISVLQLEGSLPPYSVLASSLPEKENILMTVCGRYIYFGNVRAVGKKTVRAKAPWPMEDEVCRIEHQWYISTIGGPPPSSILFKSREKVVGTIPRISGSAWLNLEGEVVGISSWEVRDEAAMFSVAYGASSLAIRSVLDYAKNKGPEDPRVMDHRFVSN